MEDETYVVFSIGPDGEEMRLSKSQISASSQVLQESLEAETGLVVIELQHVSPARMAVYCEFCETNVVRIVEETLKGKLVALVDLFQLGYDLGDPTFCSIILGLLSDLAGNAASRAKTRSPILRLACNFAASIGPTPAQDEQGLPPESAFLEQLLRLAIAEAETESARRKQSLIAVRNELQEEKLQHQRDLDVLWKQLGGCEKLKATETASREALQDDLDGCRQRLMELQSQCGQYKQEIRKLKRTLRAERGEEDDSLPRLLRQPSPRRKATYEAPPENDDHDVANESATISGTAANPALEAGLQRLRQNGGMLPRSRQKRAAGLAISSDGSGAMYAPGFVQQ
ncbi:hypothetical protein KC349_g2999 [Hortaea werneckii]|nr:hypothetical protein KC349_g2999 [Hortaea werneckii]